MFSQAFRMGQMDKWVGPGPLGPPGVAQTS